ncbi:MAG TPA: hypothetical protein VMR77_01235 [Patescibacteria group bacterium]|nr:hypothetical protein [Patescibacteria group bacterium]
MERDFEGNHNEHYSLQRGHWERGLAADFRRRTGFPVRAVSGPIAYITRVHSRDSRNRDGK